MAKFGDFLKAQAGNFVDQAANKLLGNILGGGSAEPANGFTVNRFLSTLNQQGIAKTSHFEVFVFGNGSATVERGMSMRADTVDIPGRNLIPSEHKFTNIGPANKMPIGQTYTDITTTFILSEDMREKDYFESWHNRIMNTGAYEGQGPQTEANKLAIAQTAAENNAAETEANENLTEFTPKQAILPDALNQDYTYSPFGFNYFDDYIGRVEIRQYGSGGELRSTHILNECYPLFIAPVGMSWSDDSPAKLTVTFAYRNYKVFFYKANQPSLGGGFSFSLGKGGLKFGGNIPGLGSVSYARGAGFTGNADGIAKKIFSAAGL